MVFSVVTKHDQNVFLFELHGNPDKDTFRNDFLCALDGLLSLEQPFLIVVDGSNVTGVSMTVAWSMVAWMRSNRPQLRLWLKGSGVFVRNEAVKKIMDFVFNLQPPVAPMLIANSLDEAWIFVTTMASGITYAQHPSLIHS